MKVIEKTLEYLEGTNINVKLQNIDDNSFEYVNYVYHNCFEANRHYMIKRCFKDKK